METVNTATETRLVVVPHTVPKNPAPGIEHLQRHISSSYHLLRLGTGCTAFVFPLSLWWGGCIIFGTDLQASMSAYYWSDMRDVFVGLLFAIGSFLYLYKGFSNRENIALNLAGFSAFGVALFPEGTTWVHGACAMFLFFCIAYVSIFRNGDTLKYVTDHERKAKYKRLYKLWGILMVALPVTAFVLITLLQWQDEHKNVTFGVELAGIWAFAAFWITKTFEIRGTQSDAAEAAARQMRLAPEAAAGRARDFGITAAAPPGAGAPIPDLQVPDAAAPGTAGAKALPEAQLLA